MKLRQTTAKPSREKKKSGLRENVEAILLAIVIALFIRTFIVQAFKIPSGSMMETLLIGDHILVNKFVYGIKIPFTDKTLIPIGDPKREDIIVFKYPEDPDLDFIKRVIGMPGDVIEIRNKKVFVNDELMETDYSRFTDSKSIPASLTTRDHLGPIIVPPNALFVLGDNRDNSKDSRFWGFVDYSAVKGKAFMIYWSWNKQNSGGVLDYVRWKRIGKFLK